MPRSGWLLLVCACAAGTALGAVPRAPAGGAVRAALELVPVDDPFPIRRLRAGPNLPALQKELDPGPVVRLPRAEFEARVRAAGLAVQQAKHAARVADAAYTADLDGGDLTGTAELGVLNAGGAVGFLALDPLKLAVSGAKWADGAEAAFAVLPGAAPNTTAPAVWVARDGRRVLQFKWSLAGTTEPGERLFELRVPPCPSAALELTLPAEQVPTAPADVLLTGPFEVPDKPNRRAWKFRFGGRAKLNFAVRAGGAPSTGATAALVARYDLAPGQLAATFEYELRPARGSVAEWVFAADPGLRVTDVVANNRAGWSVDPPLVPNGPRLVRVSLRQPGAGGKIVVTAVAPLPDAPLPAVRPVGAVIETEAVDIHLAPGLKVDSWSPGDYRLAEVAAPDQSRVLSLVGTLVPTGSDEAFRRMPAVRASAPESEFATFERLEWVPGAARSALVARVRVRVTRGPLFQLVLRVPPGFVLDRGAPGADELVSYIGPPAPAGQVVELARPLLAGQQADLRFEFRGAGAKPGEPVPFPVLGVIGAAERDGWLSVAADPAWAASVRPGAGALPAGLWGWLLSDSPAAARAVYSFRGREPDGFVTLVPARPLVSTQATVTLDGSGAQLVAVTRLQLTATGSLSGVVVLVPGAPEAGRAWKLLDPANGIADAVPVPNALLGALPLLAPFDHVASCAGVRAHTGAGGTLWVLRFARPLTGPAVLETTAPAPAGRAAFTLPVPQVLGAETTARAEVAPALRNRFAAEVSGKAVHVSPLAPSAAGPGTISDAYLVTAVRGPGEAVAAFGGTVRDSRGGVLPVHLPAGAEARGVCVAGRWANPASGADGALLVPVPAGAAVRFEVRYRLPAPAGWPTRRVNSPAPAAPGEPPVARWWTFAEGTLPGWPARPWETTAEGPPLLGGPLVSGPALVTRSDDEWVRVGTARGADALAVGLIALGAGCGVLLRRNRGRAAVALSGVLALAIAVVELGPPWWARGAWPVLFAAGAAALAVLALAARRAIEIGAAVPAVAFALFTVNALAQPPAPVTVLIVPGANETEDVVAPHALLQKLDTTAKPARPAPVVSSAVYEVRADEGRARVTARLVVHAFRPSDNTLSLVLPDARLERATVNGAPAFPAAPRPDTYALALPGPGRYEVEVRFAAPLTASGSEREVRFAVPEAADARLSASLPGAARQPQAVGRFGRQAVGTAGDRATLAADLGAVKQVQVRWREGAGGAAVFKVREACVWEVKEGTAELTAAYLVRVEQGTVAGMRFDVPAELEVLGVTARAVEVPAAPVALRDWLLAPEKGGARVLRVDFQAPAAGRFLVVLECAPRKPLARQPALRFPKVNFGTGKGETDAVYGLRATRVTVDEVARVGVIDFPADALKDFAAVFDPAVPVRAFRPAPGATPELRPTLRATEPAAARTLTSWRVGPARADATGTVSWSARDPVAFLEFSVPGVKVLEVRGPDVANWSQSGARVQVWLRAGAREETVEWLGTAAPFPPGKPAPGPLPFEPGHPKVANSRLVSDEVRVRAVDGFALRTERSRGWQTPPAPAGELRFRTDTATAQPLRVQLAPTR